MQELQQKSEMFSNELAKFNQELSEIRASMIALKKELDTRQSRRDRTINNNPLADMGDGRHNTKTRLAMRPYSIELETLKTKEMLLIHSFSSRLSDISEVLSYWYFAINKQSCPINPF